MRIVHAVVVLALCACGKDAKDYKNKSQRTEATMMLRKLSMNSKLYFEEKDQFLAGTAGPMPAQSCCKTGGKCQVTQDWEKDPVWSGLDFSIDEPNRFQYTYKSDGKTVSATATADLDCDGTQITYKLEMTVANGQVTSTVTPPN